MPHGGGSLCQEGLYNCSTLHNAGRSLQLLHCTQCRKVSTTAPLYIMQEGLYNCSTLHNAGRSLQLLHSTQCRKVSTTAPLYTMQEGLYNCSTLHNAGRSLQLLHSTQCRKVSTTAPLLRLVELAVSRCPWCVINVPELRINSVWYRVHIRPATYEITVTSTLIPHTS
ncbi:hypothetical protein BsWGS_26428 [Bradybaena similaris]